MKLWSYILSPETMKYWWPPSWRNRKFENNREISHNPGAFIKFYEAKQLFYNQSIEKYTLNISGYNIFMLVEVMGEKVRQNCKYFFYLRLYRLLEGPKRLIRIEGIESEPRVKPPTVARQSILEHNGAHGSAPERLLNGVEWSWNGV